MKKRFLFISCEEAKLICDKVQYNEATNWERVKLNLRISWCSIAKSYTKKNIDSFFGLLGFINVQQQLHL